MNHAGAALRSVAADVGAGEPKILAQELDEQRARVHVPGDGLAVHRHCDGRHDASLKNWLNAWFSGFSDISTVDWGQIRSILPFFASSNKFGGRELPGCPL